MIRRADTGDLGAQVALAGLLARNDLVDEAVSYWRLAEAQGHPGARYRSADALLRSEAVTANRVEGMRLLRVGAEAGHLSSIARLARALDTGLGGRPDQAGNDRTLARIARFLPNDYVKID